jgi:endonuclease III
VSTASSPSPDLVRRARRVYRRLARLYPEAGCSLAYRDRFELLIAVVLSAQCTDAKVNRVLPALFERFPTPAALGAAPLRDVEAVIRPLGLFRAKARSISQIARRAVQGIEWTMEGLRELPGVGRKTANVVLSEALGRNEGIAVDTHCGRLARRMAFSKHDDPVKVERDLVALFPKKDWGMVTHLFIAHGRALCSARNPRCAECPVRPDCPFGLKKPALDRPRKTGKHRAR